MTAGDLSRRRALLALSLFEDGGLHIQDDSLSVDAGDTVNLLVRLTKRPRSDVTVALSETSALISLGVTSLTFTPANWQDLQSVVVTAAGNRQQIDLLQAWYGVVGGRGWIALDNARPVIISGLAGGATRTFYSVRFVSTGVCALNFEDDQTGGTLGGHDLSSAFETDGQITVVAGNASISLNMAGAGTNEPYTIPATAEGQAFYNALPSDVQIAGTLTLRDYVPGDATISLSASGPDEYSGVTGSATVTVS